MARRSKVLALLVFLSLVLFTGQLFITFRQDLKMNNMQRNVSSIAGYAVSSIHHAQSDVNYLMKNFQLNDPTQQNSTHHEGHFGFERGHTVIEICRKQQQKQTVPFKEVFSIPAKQVVFCPVEKIGTTFWRRMFFMVYKNSTQYENPYDVPIGTALPNTYRFRRKVTSSKQFSLLFDNSFSFLVVRNPFSRLLSAFVDKVLAPNPTYWQYFGVKAIKAYRKLNPMRPIDGHDVTFAEFVRHVVDSESKGRNLDVHFMSIQKSCHPCHLKYDFVGKMETFKDDAMFLMGKIGIDTSVDSIKNKLPVLAIDDAILDSVYSPFSWKKDIMKSISWDKALHRIWLKLQMRGIIGLDKKLEITPKNVDMTASEFIDLARQAHSESSPEERKITKDIAKREAFASVPIDVMKAFAVTFQDDFKLFGYDDSPSYIFDPRERKVNFVLFNYTHLN